MPKFDVASNTRWKITLVCIIQASNERTINKYDNINIHMLMSILYNEDGYFVLHEIPHALSLTNFYFGLITITRRDYRDMTRHRKRVDVHYRHFYRTSICVTKTRPLNCKSSCRCNSRRHKSTISRQGISCVNSYYYAGINMDKYLKDVRHLNRRRNLVKTGNANVTILTRAFAILQFASRLCAGYVIISWRSRFEIRVASGLIRVFPDDRICRCGRLRSTVYSW